MKLARGMLVVALLGVADAKPKTVPTALVLVVDRSGSMQGNRLEAAKEMANVLLDSGLADGDQMAIVAFDSDAEVILPMVKLAKDRSPQLEKVKHIVAGGGTAILPALQLAKDQLHDVKATNKHVILLTDGEAPSEGIEALVKKMHDDDHDTVTCVGVAGADRNLLSLIADGGAGRLYMVEDIGSLPKIALKEAAEARQAH